MNKYELCLVLNAKIDEEARTAEFEKVKEHIARFGGTITKIDAWGKRRLAYEIQKMSEGFYFFVKFDAPADAPAEIESRIRIMESVMRYLITVDEA